MFSHKTLLLFMLVLLSLMPNFAYAVRLEVPADAHWLVSLGANILLYSHILSGMLGLTVGYLAVLSRKGGKHHRLFGKVFFLSMLVCYLIALFVAPFLPVEQEQNTMAAMLSLYLLLTSLSTIRPNSQSAVLINRAAPALSLLIFIISLFFMHNAGADEGEIFNLFIVISAIGFIGDIKWRLVRNASRKSRVIRHLWRMCFTFFIAAASLFFGQQQLFPDWFNETAIPQLMTYFPLLAILIWVPLVLFRHRGFSSTNKVAYTPLQDNDR